MRNATMTLSMAQAKAVAAAAGVEFPKKNNSFVKIGETVTLKRLPLPFRKQKRHAQAYRLTSPHHNDLTPFLKVADENGRSAVITYYED